MTARATKKVTHRPAKTKKSGKRRKAVLSQEDWSNWAGLTINKWTDYLKREHELTLLTCRGLSSLIALPDVMQPLTTVSVTEPVQVAYWQERIRRAKLDADRARKEAELGFPTVHARGAVSTWIFLEAFVGDVLISMIQHRPDLAHKKPFSDIKLTLSDYKRLDQSELSHIVYREIEKDTKALHNPGVTRFETVLGTVGLSGRVGAKLRRDIFELFNVRNLILHRGGIVDHRFKRNCPWRRQDKLGLPIVVKPKDYLRYFLAVAAYVVEVANRIRALCGVERVVKGKYFRKRRQTAPPPPATEAADPPPG